VSAGSAALLETRSLPHLQPPLSILCNWLFQDVQKFALGLYEMRQGAQQASQLTLQRFIYQQLNDISSSKG
jgi:hypothetical protein